MVFNSDFLQSTGFYNYVELFFDILGFFSPLPPMCAVFTPCIMFSAVLVFILNGHSAYLPICTCKAFTKALSNTQINRAEVFFLLLPATHITFCGILNKVCCFMLPVLLVVSGRKLDTQWIYCILNFVFFSVLQVWQ